MGAEGESGTGREKTIISQWPVSMAACLYGPALLIGPVTNNTQQSICLLTVTPPFQPTFMPGHLSSGSWNALTVDTVHGFHVTKTWVCPAVLITANQIYIIIISTLTFKFTLSDLN